MNIKFKFQELPQFPKFLAGVLLLTTHTAYAQYTGSYQTNTISGVVSNWAAGTFGGYYGRINSVTIHCGQSAAKTHPRKYRNSSTFGMWSNVTDDSQTGAGNNFATDSANLGANT